MKAIQGLVGVGLCLFSMGLANAQTGSKCSANVTKRSVQASTRLERAWDIQFDVTVNECPAAGTFEYIVDLTEKGQPTESETVPATFQLDKAGMSTIKVTYKGRGFKDVKEVRGIRVTSCTCGS